MNTFTGRTSHKLEPRKPAVQITASHMVYALCVGALIGFFAGLTIPQIKANKKVDFHQIHEAEHYGREVTR